MSILLRLQLESEGHFQCVAVPDDETALQRLRDESFALLIVDEVRQDASDLTSFMDALNHLSPGALPRTLLCTNRDHPSEHDSYLQVGFDYCLSKPFSKQTLLEAVHHLLDPTS